MRLDLLRRNPVVPQHVGEQLDDALELVHHDVIGPFAVDRGGIGRIARSDDDPRRRRERAGHRDNPLRRRRVVVGNDDRLGALDAGQFERVLAAGVAAQHRQPLRLGFVRAAGLSVVMMNGTRDPCSTRTSCRAASP